MRCCFTLAIVTAIAVFLAGLARSPPLQHASSSSHHEVGDIVTGALRADAPTLPSGWVVERTQSPINDAANVSVSIGSTQRVPGKLGGSIHLKLAMRCREGKPSLAVSFGDHFMVSSKYGDWGKVTYRVDRTPAVEQEWVHSSDNVELMLEGASAVDLMRKLISARAFLVRAVPFGEAPLMATFDIRGLETASSPLRSACGW